MNINMKIQELGFHNTLTVNVPAPSNSAGALNTTPLINSGLCIERSADTIPPYRTTWHTVQGQYHYHLTMECPIRNTGILVYLVLTSSMCWMRSRTYIWKLSIWTLSPSLLPWPTVRYIHTWFCVVIVYTTRLLNYAVLLPNKVITLAGGFIRWGSIIINT